MNHRPSSTASGFSLIELMIAMTVTLIISGAIYGLLTVGQRAFNREPERSDVQQNLRLAMDVLTRDIQNVGQGMHVLQPKFAPGLDNVGDGTLNPPETGPLGNWDQLLMLTDDGTCPRMYAAPNPVAATAGGAAILEVQQTLPRCVLDPANPRPFIAVIGRTPLSAVNQPPTFWGWATATAGTPSQITFATTAGGATTAVAAAAQINGAVDGVGVTGLALAPPLTGQATEWVQKVTLVRYAMAYTAVGDRVPALFRSPSGGYATQAVGAVALGAWTDPRNGADHIAAGGWEMVARGIEDFQVQYRTHDPGRVPVDQWTPTPPAVVADDPLTATVREDVRSLVVEVNVTLGGRADASTAQSEAATDGPSGRALRSRLTASISPRSVFTGIQGLTASGTAAEWR